MKYLTINEVMNQGANEPIWVLNTSARSDINQSGEIIIPIPRPNGLNSNRLIIPQTWLPTELTQQVPRTHIMEASEFRQAIMKGLIGVISESDAAKLMRDPTAKDERTRLNSANRQVQLATSRAMSEDGAVKVDAGTAKDAAQGEEFVTVAELAKAGVDEYAPGISHNFKMWVDRLKQMADPAALNELRVRRTFKRVEVKFMMNNLKGKEQTQEALSKMLKVKKAKA